MDISNYDICFQNGMPRLYWLGQDKVIGLGLLSAVTARADGREQVPEQGIRHSFRTVQRNPR